jgi:hypothetical protein
MCFSKSSQTAQGIGRHTLCLNGVLSLVMKTRVLRLLGCLMISTVMFTSSAQQAATLSRAAAQIKQKAETLRPNSAISVIPIHGEEQFGKFMSSGGEELTFYEVDRKIEVTLKYAEIRKLKNGYGGYNSISRKHTDRTKAVIAVFAVLGLLGALIGAAAAAKD